MSYADIRIRLRRLYFDAIEYGNQAHKITVLELCPEDMAAVLEQWKKQCKQLGESESIPDDLCYRMCKIVAGTTTQFRDAEETEK
jgi:hypothetical protein